MSYHLIYRKYDIITREGVVCTITVWQVNILTFSLACLKERDSCTASLLYVGLLLYIRKFALVYNNPLGEHTAAYNVDVANCDRRRREFCKTKLYCYILGNYALVYNNPLGEHSVTHDMNIANCV